MLQYERTDALGGININKSNKSKECMICHYRYIKDIGFKFEQHACKKCHDISIIAFELKNIAIFN